MGCKYEAKFIFPDGNPNGYRTDWVAFNRDLSNGMSQMDVKRKFNNGGYDIVDEHNKNNA